MEYERIFIGSKMTPQLGEVWVALSDHGLIAVEFGVGKPHFEATVRRELRRHVNPMRSGLERAVEQATCEIAEYLNGQRRRFDIPIDWAVLVSNFQRTALRAVTSIPYGETRTYGQIAAKIGCAQAPRAVGRANATNPMPLVIPCHRVIGSDGKLHGYGGKGGLKTKEWLLALEGNGRASA